MRLLNFKIRPILICRQTSIIKVQSAGDGQGFKSFLLGRLNNFQSIPRRSAGGQFSVSREFSHA